MTQGTLTHRISTQVVLGTLTQTTPQIQNREVSQHHNKTKTRGDINIIDEFSSQTGGQGAPTKRDKTPSPAECALTPDTVLLTVQMRDTEFPTLGKA